MSTVAKAKAAAQSFMPTKEEAIAAAEAVGGVTLGIIASHAALNLLKKQDSALVSGVLAIGGFAGACKVQHPLAKMVLVGVGAYGTIKTLNNVTKVVATPGATEGLAGMLPESVKEAMRKFIPTFAGIEEVSGMSGLGADDEFGHLSLDDQGAYSTDGLGEYEDMSGAPIGAIDLAA